jgi:surface antigen
MRSLKPLSVLAIVCLLVACQDTGPKQGAGTLLGAGGGALIGSQVGHGRGQLVGVAAGALLGALVGSEIGKSLDQADRDRMTLANQRALETLPPGQSLPWRNPESGNSGTVTPKAYYKTESGGYCREFQQTITVGGQTQQGYGTACRQPDGSWKIVN